MADVAVPAEMINWMTARGWSAHHVEWHFVRRWDFWRARAPQDPEVQAMVDEADAQGWMRAAIQEGEPGSGLDFLLMHRAMFILLHRDFPQYSHLLRGWTTPPTNPADRDDPVPDGAAFGPNQLQAVAALEAAPGVMIANTDDAWGLFLETNIRPTSADPARRSDDFRTGLHNYLHNRWSVGGSPIDLGDPEVNIFNERFWRLHGWIDYQWWRHRRARRAFAGDPAYQVKLQHYLTMMDHGHGPHPHAAHDGHEEAALPQLSSGKFRAFFKH